MILILDNKRGRNVLELVGKALELSKKGFGDVRVLLIGYGFRDPDELLEYGIKRVYVADHPSLKRFSLDPYLKIARDVVGKLDPDIVLAPATTTGRTLMPALAATFRTGLTADCTELDVGEKGEFLQTRPAIGGNIMATIVIPNHRPKMATVRPRTFEIPEKIGRIEDSKVVKLDLPPSFLEDRCELLEFRKRESEVNVQEADVVVSVGKGLRRKENVEVAKRLANLVGGAVGATRAVVDAKWLSHDHQIGLSGKTVQPKVYIAAGISGAVQHIAGMQTSELVIAINKDKYAPIFKVADIGLVADATSTLEEIVRRLRREKE